jgi:hypothetical protein
MRDFLAEGVIKRNDVNWLFVRELPVSVPKQEADGSK